MIKITFIFFFFFSKTYRFSSIYINVQIESEIIFWASLSRSPYALEIIAKITSSNNPSEYDRIFYLKKYIHTMTSEYLSSNESSVYFLEKNQDNIDQSILS